MSVTDQSLLTEIVYEICSQLGQLDDPKRQLFLEWLKDHCGCVNSLESSHAEVAPVVQGRENGESCLKNSLKTWFESLPAAEILWEYRMILREISWWRDLDEMRLARIIERCRREGSCPN